MILRDVERAFDQAVNEPKITSREELIKSNSVTLLPKIKSKNLMNGGDITSLAKNAKNCNSTAISDTADFIVEYRWSPNVPMGMQNISSPKESHKLGGRDGGQKKIIKKDATTDDLKETEKEGSKKTSELELNSMRKHMTRLYDELLSTYDDVVYIGEDVQHGGYYLVTEGLAEKHPLRYTTRLSHPIASHVASFDMISHHVTSHIASYDSKTQHRAPHITSYCHII